MGVLRCAGAKLGGGGGGGGGGNFRRRQKIAQGARACFRLSACRPACLLSSAPSLLLPPFSLPSPSLSSPFAGPLPTLCLAALGELQGDERAARGWESGKGTRVRQGGERRRAARRYRQSCMHACMHACMY